MGANTIRRNKLSSNLALGWPIKSSHDGLTRVKADHIELSLVKDKKSEFCGYDSEKVVQIN